MRGILLLALLAGAAFATISQSGGDSFENALGVGQETFPVGGEPGSKHYFVTNIEAGDALSIERYCEDQNASLELYDESRQLLVSGNNRTTWSASSDNQTYVLYFVVTLCSGSDWITVSVENRQDLGSGTDAGKDFEGAIAALGGAHYNCCHLSLNNGAERGNDNEDMYLLSTIAGNTVTIDTLAPLELTAYTADGTELGSANGKLSFMPQTLSSYFLVRATPEFSAGATAGYSLTIEGLTAAPDSGTPAQQQQQASGAGKNGTRRETKRANATTGQADAPEDSGQQETPAEKGALEAIYDQISGTIKLVKQDYALPNISAQKTDDLQGGGSTAKKAIALIIAACAIALIIRARKSS